MSNATSKKRDNGTGSVRQKRNGLWEARITINGEQKSLYGKTESEAKRKLREYTRLKARGYNNVKKVTLGEYINNWLITFKMGVVKPSTFDRMESTYLHHIKNEIGKRQMGSLTSRDLQNYINEKVNPSNKNKLPLSRSSVKKIMEIIVPCLDYACKVGDLNFNPAVYVTIPKQENFVIKTKQMFALDDVQMAALKTVAELKRKNGEPYYRYADVFMVMLNTGVRVGEMLAIEWDDIDFSKKLMHVNKGFMSNIKNRESNLEIKRIQILSSTKTVNGDRIIPLNESAIYYLEKIKKYKDVHQIDTKYVVYGANGNYVTARNLQRTFDLVLSKASLAHCGLHILRHSFGSSLIRKGVDISVVSKLMGHSSPSITRSKYIHVLKEQQIEAVELLNII